MREPLQRHLWLASERAKSEHAHLPGAVAAQPLQVLPVGQVAR